MNKTALFSVLAITLLAVLMLNSVSAYTPTFKLSDNIVFREDIKGENRGFSLSRSADVSRLTSHGYYDWSYRPRNVRYPHPSTYQISDRLALQAFRTFQRDSDAQNRLELERERNRYRYYGYFGGYRSYYGGYYGGYFPRYYGYRY